MNEEILIDAATLNLMAGLFIQDVEADEDADEETKAFADALSRFTVEHAIGKGETFVLSVKKEQEA